MKNCGLFYDLIKLTVYKRWIRDRLFIATHCDQLYNSFFYEELFLILIFINFLFLF